MEKRKTNRRVLTICGIVLALAALAGAFFGGIRYNKVQNEKKKPTVDTVALAEDLVSIAELATTATLTSTDIGSPSPQTPSSSHTTV